MYKLLLTLLLLCTPCFADTIFLVSAGTPATFDGSTWTGVATNGADITVCAIGGGGGGSFLMPTPLKVPTIGNGLYAANVTTGYAQAPLSLLMS